MDERDWVAFEHEKPSKHGYYYVRYLHKSGQIFYKAIWWDGKEFRYKDYVIKVYSYLSKQFDYYCPCLMWAEGLGNE